jgi:hypothetical protein
MIWLIQRCNRRRVSLERLPLALLVLLGMSVVSGCGPKRVESDYVPAASQARQALEQMLASWQRGETDKSEFQLAGDGPRVQIIDKEFKAGKRLLKSEIVSEKPTEPNGPRQITVKLTFEGSDASVEATYFVVGIDPLLIFRDKEYAQASGMG